MHPGGTTPALQFGDTLLGDSYKIVEYLDQTYPSPPLSLPGNKEAEEVTGQIFGVFSEYAKNQDASKEAELEAKFTAELQKIEDFLGKSPGAFLCGDSWSIADCVLVPRLYHITVVARHYKRYSKYEEMTNLVKYMDNAFSTDVFKATDYPPEFILHGWAKYFQ